LGGLSGYIHPLFQGTVLLAGLYLLWLGLRIRRLRRREAAPGLARLAGRHMRLGRWFTALFSAGYILGLGGMGLALEEPLWETAHSYFATVAVLLVWGTAFLGRRLRLRPGDSDLRQIHAYCAFVAIFVALAVAFLGMNLLP